MSSRISAALLVVLVAALATTSVAATPALQSGVAASQTTATETPTPVTENTTFYLQLQRNGDARWTVTDTYALDDQNDTEAFEELAQQYVDGEADTGWETAFREANEAATAATGREMNITGMNKDYVVNEQRGTLVLEFTWENFATVEDGRLVIDDAFDTPSGTWLGSLTANQTLVISAPAGYGVQSSPPTMGVQNGELRFVGPRTFEPGYLEIVYTGDDETSVPGTEETPGGGLLGDPPLWIGAALMLVIGLVVAARYIDRDGDVPAAGAASTTGDGGSDAGTAEATNGASAESTDAAEDDVDLTLLSDEERVEHLLEQNGGRMKQARIVKETGWSNAKVSQLLSAMDEDDRIDKLRIGRENLISFPDEDVTEIDE
ncbi:hypothetical protein EGH21_13790 [Halomicroarcula sp. F13]|uniref:Uncharacterized protein n=1 Tax=Haloarcula rubra TaxID=2487747 RepID=A0AAW4PUA5_9EURY|nr:hypothetical protein [Halomicroarcula rubra]MBX0324105.1 hypothetical protein [Halomicroarcula rubra]